MLHAQAARAERSLNEFIAGALPATMLADRQPADTPSLLPLFTGGEGLRLGVNPDSNAALADLMEDGDRVR